MEKIKFGSDGWKAIIAKDFTLDNVAKISLATALWLNRKYRNPSVVIGYDCRFNGEMFQEATAKIMASKGIRVYIAERYVTTPMVSLGIIKLQAQCGIILTASHYPAEYNGYKLRGDHGGPMSEKDLKDIENLVSNELEIDIELLNWNYLLEQGTIQYIDIENIYIKEVHDNFNLEAIQNSNLKFAFDAMYGSSQHVMRKLLPEVRLMHGEVNPSFNGIPPEPIRKNLHELAELVWKTKTIDCSLAVDGDGDRVALFDRECRFMDANLIILLLIHYLAGYRQQKGKVIVSFPTTGKVECLCKQYGLEVLRTRVGFSYSSRIMTEQDILLAGEESGGIAVGGHIPDQDGIWAGLKIWQWMAECRKPLHELYNEVISITGPFSVEKANLEMNRNQRNKVIEMCTNGSFSDFGRFHINRYEIFDGCKFFFDGNAWLLIRSSSTEPVIRLYAEAETQELAQEIIYSGIKKIVET